MICYYIFKANRLEVEKATVIQAFFRGRKCRNAIKMKLKIEFSSKLLELHQKLQNNIEISLGDIRFVICTVRFIYPRHFPWHSPTIQNKNDCEKMASII